MKRKIYSDKFLYMFCLFINVLIAFIIVNYFEFSQSKNFLIRFLLCLLSHQHVPWWSVGISQSIRVSLKYQRSSIVSFPLNVQVHILFKYMSDVISEPDLLYSRKGIPKNFKDQNVIEMCLIAMLWDEQMLPTKHIVLTFNSPSPSIRI